MFDHLFDLSLLKELLDWKAASYVLLGGVLLTFFKFINGLFSGYHVNTELTEKDNKAIAVSLSGFLFALFMVIHGVLINPGDWSLIDNPLSEWLGDLRDTSIWASIGCTYLLLSRIINDKLILYKFSNRKELVADRNIGVGVVQAGSYIATAFIIRATLTGPDSLSLGEEISLTLIWFIVTQLLLIGFSFVYQFITRYDIHAALREGNTAAGIAFAGNLIAFSILLAFYIKSYESLPGLLIWATLSTLLLYLVRIIVDKALLPNQKLDQEISKDKNWGAGMIEAITVIGSALIISGSFS